jgi:hypothetical protein
MIFAAADIELNTAPEAHVWKKSGKEGVRLSGTSCDGQCVLPMVVVVYPADLSQVASGFRAGDRIRTTGTLRILHWTKLEGPMLTISAESLERIGANHTGAQ